MVSFTRQLTQSRWLYRSDTEEEVIRLILLLSPKSSHHPAQIAINMSMKTTFAQHERACRLAAPCPCKSLLQVWEPGHTICSLYTHIHTLHFSHTDNKANILPLWKSSKMLHTVFFKRCSPIVTTSTHTYTQIFMKAGGLSPWVCAIKSAHTSWGNVSVITWNALYFGSEWLLH